MGVDYMKVMNSSVCLSCKFFDHECGDTQQQVDYECFETCSHHDDFITDGFAEHTEILRCSGFTGEQR